MNCLFMYNPHSGKGKITKKIDYIERELGKKYDSVEIYATQKPKDMTEKAKWACGKYDALIFAGGDGSFNEVLNGIATEEKKPTLGYVPCGTVNDIAHSLKIPRKGLKRAVKRVVEGEERKLDIMKINEDYAIYVLAGGSLTSCSYKAPQQDKKKHGKFAYVFEILKHDLKVKNFDIEVNTEKEKHEGVASLMLGINSRSVASMLLNRKAVLDDGEIEVILVNSKKEPNFIKKTSIFFRILQVFAFGYNMCKNKRVYKKLKGSHFEIKVDNDFTWNYDGEEGKKGTITLDVIKQAITVIV